MLVRIRLFARLREIAGADELQRTLPDGATAESAWDGLASEFTALAPYRAAVSCAVNEEYARMSTPLRDGDEIAFLPPVSGGAEGTARRADGYPRETARTRIHRLTIHRPKTCLTSFNPSKRATTS